jgi:integrase
MRPTGHLQVKGPPGRRRWYALWRDADGRHQRVLGPAHVKPAGRLTARGAVVWRSGDGRKPGPEWLTPRQAEDRLASILAEAPRLTRAPSGVVTFEHACAEWLRYVEHDRQRAASTLRDYRNAVRRYLVPGLGATTPVAAITTEDIDAFRERMLAEGQLSRRSIQKILVMVHGVLKRAKRRKWIVANPAEDAERVTVSRSGDFSVLTPEEVESLARAASCEQDAAIFIVAAFTGLRLGELRGLRWGDVDFARRTPRRRSPERRERLVDVAAHEPHVLPDSNARQAAVAGVLEHGLGRDAAEQRADLVGSEQRFVDDRERRGHRICSSRRERVLVQRIPRDCS